LPRVTSVEAIPGQSRAGARLQRAAARPVHAYLLTGPRGSGVERAARALAAALIVPAGDDRVRDLVARGVHPDVAEFDPPESQIRVDAARAVVEEAHRSPIECDRKVVVLLDADRLNEAAANKLLKTIEEPPPRTHLILVTAAPDALLDTVRSRCARIDLDPLTETAITTALEAEGVAPEPAARAARLASGQLDRARELAGRLGPVRAAFVDAAGALDGTGRAVADGAEAIQTALRDAMTDLEQHQQAEAAQLETALAEAGYPERTARARRRQLEERHKRQHRRARIDALLEGITALESLYRDALAGAGAPARNLDREPLRLEPSACIAALGACRAARAAFEFNPNEGLLVEHLLFELPSALPGPDR
jgi:DNA polymerase-3 subunit delta'